MKLIQIILKHIQLYVRIPGGNYYAPGSHKIKVREDPCMSKLAEMGNYSNWEPTVLSVELCFFHIASEYTKEGGLPQGDCFLVILSGSEP